MILPALVKHYENLAEEGKVSRPGWCSAKVAYQIDLSREGEIKGIISLREEEERGKKKVIAVSYTHLDVYKRQVVNVVVFRGGCENYGIYSAY